jgi:molybdate transport system substrate-binding protein
MPCNGMLFRLLVALGILSAVGTIAEANRARADGVVTVSAAVSLTDALQSIARSYAESGGGPIRFNFAASNVLARQIMNGAPVDLFISADEAQMELTAKAGAIDVETRIPLVGNVLAVVTLPRGPSVADTRGLLQPSVRRIAIGDPAAVPAGVYARTYLERIGLWNVLEPKLVPVANVRAALASVENGAVDAAITYETDVVTASTARVAFLIRGDMAPRIVYPAAIVSAAPNRQAAERLLKYLHGPAASALFRRYKFVPLAG